MERLANRTALQSLQRPHTTGFVSSILRVSQSATCMEPSCRDRSITLTCRITPNSTHASDRPNTLLVKLI